MPSEYGRTLNLVDFGVTADLVVTAGSTGGWQRWGTQYTVPAGVKVAVGRRFDGYCACILKDTADNAMHALVRVVATDPQEFRKIVLLEFNTRTTTSLSDKRLKKLTPLTMPWVRQDSKMFLEVYPEAGDTYDKDLTFLTVDVTVFVP